MKKSVLWLPRDTSEDEDGVSDRTNAGPPPSWDGNTSFKDYWICAKLWMVTTKTKPRARGPLKNLSGIPFDSMKYLARDDAWLKDEHNGEKLLKVMDTKELFGEDDRENMLASLVKITYGLRRAKNEDYQSFFTKWDNAVRKLDEHQIVLPPGKLGSKSVKEWVRVHETNLDLTKTTSSTTASSTDKRASMILLAEDEIEHGNDYPDDDGDLEILLNAMTSLDSDDGTISEDSNQVFDEDEVKEVLAAMPNVPKNWPEAMGQDVLLVTASKMIEIKENHLLENQEAFFLNYLEYKRSQATAP
ncbi:unnamed protein product [Symbiodinium pilosum]|uniref:Uncharacterized protein n=1 Tax=Symbiodinium pilosum TaxID=2952 RepID=A0A812IM97_SYMPI|nr:unnamed protein product [Symbiodinium pilosum]